MKLTVWKAYLFYRKKSKEAEQAYKKFRKMLDAEDMWITGDPDKQVVYKPKKK